MEANKSARSCQYFQKAEAEADLGRNPPYFGKKKKKIQRMGSWGAGQVKYINKRVREEEATQIHK